jgi:hypothetical protein
MTRWYTGRHWRASAGDLGAAVRSGLFRRGVPAGAVWCAWCAARHELDGDPERCCNHEYHPACPRCQQATHHVPVSGGATEGGTA